MQQAKPKALANEELDELAINTIRTRSIDAIHAGEVRSSWHADGAGAVVTDPGIECCEFDPQDPIRPNRDRFVLSKNGHASMLLWSCAVSDRHARCERGLRICWGSRRSRYSSAEMVFKGNPRTSIRCTAIARYPPLLELGREHAVSTHRTRSRGNGDPSVS